MHFADVTLSGIGILCITADFITAPLLHGLYPSCKAQLMFLFDTKKASDMLQQCNDDAHLTRWSLLSLTVPTVQAVGVGCTVTSTAAKGKTHL